MITDKKITLDLSTTDGTTTEMIEAFTRQAKYEGWGYLEIEHVLDVATSYDYLRLYEVLNNRCK